MRTSSASSTSALPQLPLAERLPCLATGTPQAATTSEATVEMLKVPAPSPPVPQVSTAPRETQRHRARAHRAREAHDLVLGLAAHGQARPGARRSAPGVASPSMIMAMAAPGFLLA